MQHFDFRSCQLCPAAESRLDCSCTRRHTDFGLQRCLMISAVRGAPRGAQVGQGLPGWLFCCGRFDGGVATVAPPLPVPVRRNLRLLRCRDGPRAGMAAPAADDSYGFARSNHHGSKLLEIVVIWCNLLGGAAIQVSVNCADSKMVC